MSSERGKRMSSERRAEARHVVVRDAAESDATNVPGGEAI